MNKALSVRRCAVIILVLAMAPTLAQAYIDPGSGAYMVQALFALVGAMLFYLRHPVRSLRAFGCWVISRWRKVDGASGSDAAPRTEHETASPDMNPSPAMNEAVASPDEAH
jgi:hypothetical protein